MKAIINWSIIAILTLVLGYFALGFISSYVGWYGYKKWQDRVGTSDIAESKKRWVFIKKLHFQIDSFPGKIANFIPYIEFGFRYGRHSDEETVLLTNSNYPYQLCYGYSRMAGVGFLLRIDQLEKFDSSNRTQGFLKYPNLKDTVILDIIGKDIHSGIIKIWE